MAGFGSAAAAAREEARRADGRFGEQVHADPGDDIIVTEVPVMYRDASNYKAFGSVTFPGTLNAGQRDRLRAALDGGEYFIPEQLGLHHLGPELMGFPGEDDHAFHELDLEDVTETKGWAPYPGNPEEQHIETHGTYRYESAEAFVQAMEKAAADGWDAARYSPADFWE